jgi:hypothetical protein
VVMAGWLIYAAVYFAFSMVEPGIESGARAGEEKTRSAR